MSKAKYAPDSEYTCTKTVSLRTPNGRTVYQPGDTFKMTHRSPQEIQYLVEVIRAIKPAGGKK